jgi:hypothetical protein
MRPNSNNNVFHFDKKKDSKKTNIMYSNFHNNNKHISEILKQTVNKESESENTSIAKSKNNIIGQESIIKPANRYERTNIVDDEKINETEKNKIDSKENSNIIKVTNYTNENSPMKINLEKENMLLKKENKNLMIRIMELENTNRSNKIFT